MYRRHFFLSSSIDKTEHWIVFFTRDLPHGRMVSAPTRIVPLLYTDQSYMLSRTLPFCHDANGPTERFDASYRLRFVLHL